jgi:tetratricopeptide (TPR) repeat protein
MEFAGAIVGRARPFCMSASCRVVANVLAVALNGLLYPAYALAHEELADAQARVEYAFYTSDTRSLEDVLQSLERLEIDAPLVSWRHYYAAFGYWKLAQLYSEQAAQGGKGARGKADRAGDACAEHANQAIERDARFFEAQALKAACSRFGFAARVGDLATAAGCSRNKALRAAQAAEPKNPRIKLIDAWCVSNSAGVKSKALYEKARAAVNAFEAAPFNAPGAPNWGEPEALTLLGEVYLQRGEARAARDLLEHALAIAPDYRKAQELLNALSQ